jgi:hypothetical protein
MLKHLHFPFLPGNTATYSEFHFRSLAIYCSTVHENYECDAKQRSAAPFYTLARLIIYTKIASRETHPHHEIWINELLEQELQKKNEKFIQVWSNDELLGRLTFMSRRIGRQH